MSESTEPKPTIRESIRILFGASRGYWLVNIANFGDGVAYFGMLALMTLFLQHEVGLTARWSTTSIGMFTGAVTVFMALGGGVVSDRLGVRRALSLCIFILLIGRVLFALSPGLAGNATIVAAAIALFIMAAGEGVIQPALYAGIKEYTDRRTETLGYAILYSIMNLGIVVGEFISPLAREGWAKNVERVDIGSTPTAGITGAFWFFIGVTVVMLTINVVFFTRRVEHRDRRADIAAVAPEENFSWGDYLRNLPILNSRFLFFIAVLLPVRTLFAHQWLTMPDYVTRAFPPEVGMRWEWLNGLNPLVIVIGVPVIAALTQRARVVDMMIIGTSVSALATFMLVPPPNTALLIAYFIVFSLGEAAWSSRFLEYVADISPAGKVGIYMGIAGLPWFLAKTTTGFYAGAVLDAFVPGDGPQRPGTMWLIYGVIALTTPIGLLLARGWLNRGVHRADGADA